MPIIKTVDGKFYRVEDEQEVSAEDLQNEVNQLNAKAANIEAVLGVNPPSTDQPATDAPVLQ